MEKPRISVFTPVHPTSAPYLKETYQTLLEQTEQAWQWVLVQNNNNGTGCLLDLVPPYIAADARVKVVQGGFHRKIGAHKRLACEHCDADVLLELDADDLLRADALELVLAEVAAGGEFIYSDCASFRQASAGAAWESTWSLPNGAPAYPYGKAFGWAHYPVEFKGAQLLAMRAPEATAHNLRRIEWSPDHLRAWTREAYWAVKGHDPDRPVADDHDLMVRFYLAGKRFRHIPEPLYYYRVHGKNTVVTDNAAIQVATDEIYADAIYALAITWARRQGLLTIDLCGGIDAPEGFLALDKYLSPEVLEKGQGIQADLEGHWPLPESSVGVLRAHDAVEHLRDPVHTMNEAWRVLAPGGFFLINVPSTSGPGAFCDPTHVSYWNALSFRYYTNQRFARYLPHFKGRFQVARVREFTDSAGIPYVGAQLIALKDGYHPMGLVQI